jgi:hypothetical protein
MRIDGERPAGAGFGGTWLGVSERGKFPAALGTIANAPPIFLPSIITPRISLVRDVSPNAGQLENQNTGHV